MVTIYVLKCNSEKYYVGRSSNPNVRIESHRSGYGSAWTSKYPPLELVKTYPNCDGFDEDKYVLKYMSQYGVDNVRGGSYSQIALSDEQRRNIERQLAGAEDRCFKCGKSGHFVRDCKIEVKKIEEVKNADIIDDYFVVPDDFTNISAIPEPTSRSWWDIGFRILDEILDNSKNRCFRCGRKGHWVDRCYAKRDVTGKFIG